MLVKGLREIEINNKDDTLEIFYSCQRKHRCESRQRSGFEPASRQRVKFVSYRSLLILIWLQSKIIDLTERLRLQAIYAIVRSCLRAKENGRSVSVFGPVNFLAQCCLRAKKNRKLTQCLWASSVQHN